MLATIGDAQARPNVLVILTDDQGFGDIRSHGNPDIETPVLDRLAAAGARFNRFYVSPVCSPTRASFLTGLYHERLGVSGTSTGKETMRLGFATIADVFKAAGYATGCFGKWHNGGHYPYHPNARGFDEFFGFCLGHWNNYFDTTLERNGIPEKTTGYINDVVTDAALDFINDNRDQPFFCYVPYNTPHTPFQVPDEYFDACKKRGLDDVLAAAYGMCENLDDNIGRLLKALDAHGIADNTIVVFFGDNGPNTERFNDGMRGRKGSVHEGGVRNSLFIRWPANIRPGTVVEPIAAHIDLLPTLAKLAEIELNVKHPLDGVSLAPLLRGESVNWPARTIYSQWNGRGAVRTDRYRLTMERDKVGLFDIRNDPGEKIDLADEQRALLNELRQAYAAWYADVSKDGFEVPPIPVGYHAMPTVTLTCSEGEWEGGLEWGGRFPNNNWATNWTSIDDTVTWEIDVVDAVEYSITLEYICPEPELGSRIRVTVGGESIEGVLDVAAEPNFEPSPDRVPRTEVYERKWGYMTLGTIELPTGRSTVTIQARAVAGRSVMDLKSIQLEKNLPRHP